MHDATDMPKDLASCWATIQAQADANAQQAQKIEELTTEMEKLRKMLSHFVNGHTSEKRVFPDARQTYLPFEDSQEYQEARAEAEAEAERIIQTYTVRRSVRKQNRRRDESFPSHLRREEQIVDATGAVSQCPMHGARTVIGYDTTETLIHRRPELYVLVKKYPKYACEGHAECGVGSPERPTSLVEGDRYSTSIAAAIVEAKWFHYLPLYRQQDLFAGSGWVPSRSTLKNVVGKVEFAVDPFLLFMTRRVQADIGVGIDDTSCRMLLPQVIPEAIPGDAKSQRLAEKVAEARAKKQDSLLAKMWVYSGLHLAPYNIFDFRVSRHRDGPDDFFQHSRCKVQGDCFSGNLSVVLKSDERLEFVACWGHARRKVTEAETYQAEAEQLLRMIQALYDIETRAKDMTWHDREALRKRESSVVLNGIKAWLDSIPLQTVLPKSDFAEALRYLHNHWESLNAFVQDGRIPIDNNSVEQLMKQVALGRKAWLFVGNVEAGEQSAKMMTLVSSARRHDLDVGVYIQDVLDQLLAGQTDYESLLPDVWKKSHPEAVRVYRQEERRDKADRKQYEAAQRRRTRRALDKR
jgi:transposase